VSIFLRLNKMANKWIAHVKKTMKRMKSRGTYKKGMGLKQVIMEAKKDWHKVKSGGGESEEEEETATVVESEQSEGMGGRRRRKHRKTHRRRKH
jgi:hypothetical protein